MLKGEGTIWSVGMSLYSSSEPVRDDLLSMCAPSEVLGESLFVQTLNMVMDAVEREPVTSARTRVHAVNLQK